MICGRDPTKVVCCPPRCDPGIRPFAPPPLARRFSIMCVLDVEPWLMRLELSDVSSVPTITVAVRPSVSSAHPLSLAPRCLLVSRTGCEGSRHGVRHVRDGRRHRWVNFRCLLISVISERSCCAPSLGRESSLLAIDNPTPSVTELEMGHRLAAGRRELPPRYWCASSSRVSSAVVFVLLATCSGYMADVGRACDSRMMTGVECCCLGGQS